MPRPAHRRTYRANGRRPNAIGARPKRQPDDARDREPGRMRAPRRRASSCHAWWTPRPTSGGSMAAILSVWNGGLAFARCPASFRRSTAATTRRATSAVSTSSRATRRSQRSAIPSSLGLSQRLRGGRRASGDIRGALRAVVRAGAVHGGREHRRRALALAARVAVASPPVPAALAVAFVAASERPGRRRERSRLGRRVGALVETAPSTTGAVAGTKLEVSLATRWTTARVAHPGCGIGKRASCCRWSSRSS